MTDAGFGAGAIRPGHELDWDTLADYLRAALGLEGQMVVAEFVRGSSSLNYLIGFGDSWMVLRRPPLGGAPSMLSDIRREHTIMSQLWRRYPRVPRSRLLCTDHSVIGSDFIIQDLRNGEVIWNRLPQSFAELPDVGRRVGYAVIDALADLHDVDPDSCGLGDLAPAGGFLADRLDAMVAMWRSVADDDLAPLGLDLAAGLHATAPARSRRAIVHLDFRLNNCQFAPGEPDRVTSVFDWDAATVGDPLLDVGIMLNYWPDPGDNEMDHADVPAVYADLGLPSRADLIARYAARMGVDGDEFAWYKAYGAWRSAIIRQAEHRRHFDDPAVDPSAPRSIDVPALISRARRLLAQVDA